MVSAKCFCNLGKLPLASEAGKECKLLQAPYRTALQRLRQIISGLVYAFIEGMTIAATLY